MAPYHQAIPRARRAVRVALATPVGTGLVGYAASDGAPRDASVITTNEAATAAPAPMR